ncbi:hypothetical protein QM996_01140 [Sinorhizobium chiapasense]
MQSGDFFSVNEFLTLAGFSRTWINTLWVRGEGPPRQTIRVGGQNRVRIPVIAGLAWLLDRYPERARHYEKLSDLIRFDRHGHVTEIFIEPRADR